MMEEHIALVLGASGLVGSFLVTELLQSNHYTKIVVFVRKKLPFDHHKLEQIITDFDHINEVKNHIKGDALFCCLGSTKRKTPDLKIYRKVDHDYPLQFAQYAAANGVQQFHLVSAIGANAQSSNFYLKMKGETEADLSKVDFASLYIYRPSFLMGNRNENRPLEKFVNILMKVIDSVLLGSLKKYRSVLAADVAKAMLNESITNKRGIFVLQTERIKELA